MRVIAGTHSGRLLKAAAGRHTRPTSDKVKEAMFSILGPFFEGGRGLDLFAGTGALGIEALSRGLKQVIFVDDDRVAVHVIRENLSRLGLEDQAVVLQMSAETALKVLSKAYACAGFDYVFMDPPYGQVDLIGYLEHLSEKELLTPGATVVIEHEASRHLSQAVGTVHKVKEKTYGLTALSFYQNETT